MDKCKSDLISIIVPIYNVEDYLERCVLSIINQSYKELEIILVDDGSTDSSGAIAEKLQKRDSRIKVLHKENGGLSSARNFGIKHCNGKYIGFVDSDDFINKDMYKVLYENLIDADAEISIIGNKYFFEHDSSIANQSIKRNGAYTILNKFEAIKNLLLDNNIGSYAWNKLYKIEIFNSIMYPEGKKMEDIGTTYKLFDKAKKIVYEKTQLYYYFQHQGSIINGNKKDVIIDNFDFSYERYICIDEKYNYMLENDIYVLKMILMCYPYIDNDRRKKCTRLLKNKLKIRKLIKHLTIKEKIKLFVFKFNKKLYATMFYNKKIK